MFVGTGESGTAWPYRGFLDDTAIFDGAMSAAYVRGVYELAIEPTLEYHLEELNQLLEMFEATTGSVTLGDDTWIYGSGLSGTPGDLQLVGDHYELVLDEFGNGILTFVVPEPSTMVLLGLGVVGLAIRARRRSAESR
jgi:hypothetical protein